MPKIQELNNENQEDVIEIEETDKLKTKDNRIGMDEFYEIPKNLSLTTKDWKGIHPDFTEELQKEWEEKGFDYEKCKRWIDIGLKVNDADYAWWLKNVESKNAEGVLNHESEKELRERFRKYQFFLERWGDLKKEKLKELKKIEKLGNYQVYLQGVLSIMLYSTILLMAPFAKNNPSEWFLVLFPIISVPTIFIGNTDHFFYAASWTMFLSFIASLFWWGLEFVLRKKIKKIFSPRSPYNRSNFLFIQNNLTRRGKSSLVREWLDYFLKIVGFVTSTLVYLNFNPQLFIGLTLITASIGLLQGLPIFISWVVKTISKLIYKKDLKSWEWWNNEIIKEFRKDVRKLGYRDLLEECDDDKLLSDKEKVEKIVEEIKRIEEKGKQQEQTNESGQLMTQIETK